ncbi:hypothetical protein [Streptomyces sp. NPDC001307]|uniref:hypothetical protein n=1 Tax=Streptomyces sp. NPDC001307 TaxID=3364560 RepID=UPI0036C29FBD
MHTCALVGGIGMLLAALLALVLIGVRAAGARHRRVGRGDASRRGGHRRRELTARGTAAAP